MTRISKSQKKYNIFFDSRWSGDHGIGRVSRMLDAGLCLPRLILSGKPASPLDPLRLLIAMLKLGKADAVLSPGFNVPLFVIRPYIFTLHDLNHIDRPENTSTLKRLYYRLILRRACNKAYKILTVSEFSRQRILTWAQVPEERVVNIGNGVDSSFKPDVVPYEPGYQYLLCVGNRKAHKNEVRVLKGFAKAIIPKNVCLVFTGNVSEQLMELSEQLGVLNRVFFVGCVPERDLPSLYRGAIALVFPSLYEGFGLPIIEAMACGTPVLTSNTTSLPEVAGDAALLVDPESVDEISSGIELLHNDEELRNALSTKGLKQAQCFSWDTVVSRVKTILDEYQHGVIND